MSGCVDCKYGTVEEMLLIFLTMKDVPVCYHISKVKTCEIVANLNTKIWITGLNSSLGGGGGGLVKCDT